MPAAMIAWYVSMYIYATAAAMIAVLGAAYGIASAFQARSRAASERSNALQAYYNDVANYNTKNKAFSASKASSRSAFVNAAKYTNASEMQILEAMRREKASKKAWEGFRPRTTVGRQQDFGNRYSAKAVKAVQDTELVLQETILGSTKVERPESLFDVSNLSVQNFNTNFVGEV